MMGNEPRRPPSGTICSVRNCGEDAVQTWIIAVTDASGNELYPRDVDYCSKHNVPNPPM